MTETHALERWSDFYVIVGSAAAALTGLTFVVITIVMGEGRRSKQGINTFTSPTVLHFGSALFLSAVATAPWPGFVPLSICIALVGAFGLAMSALVGRGMIVIEYDPDLDDWTWYVLAPGLAYGTLIASAIALPHAPHGAPFATAAGTLGLIFIGIHNAWDVVTFIAANPVESSSASGASETKSDQAGAGATEAT